MPGGVTFPIPANETTKRTVCCCWHCSFVGCHGDLCTYMTQVNFFAECCCCYLKESQGLTMPNTLCDGRIQCCDCGVLCGKQQSKLQEVVNENEDGPDQLCTCMNSDMQFCCCRGLSICMIVKPRSCCKAEHQCCCIYEQLALPTDDHTPCAVGCCGIKCAGTYPGDPTGAELQDEPKPPAGQEMERTGKKQSV